MTVPVRLVGELSAVPTTTTAAGVLLDLPAAVDALIRADGTVRPVPEWWLGAADATAAAQAAGELPGVTVLNREAVIEAAADDPYWRGSRTGMLAAALGAVLLALVGLMVDVWATARRRLGEFAVLHTLGATPRLMARALLAEQTFLAGIGVGVGLLLGTAVGATMAPLVILTPAAGRPTPPAAFALPWVPIGLTAVGLLLAALAFSAFIATGIRQRVAAVQLRIGESDERRGGRPAGPGVRGQFLLLAVLTLVVTLLISGVPRLVNRLAEQGLRAQLNSEPAARRDLAYTSRVEPATSRRTAMGDAAERFDALAADMPQQVRSAVTERWYSVETAEARVVGPDLAARNLLVDLGLRAMPDMQGASTLVEGTWPSETYVPDRPIEVALDVDVARKLNLRAGSQLRIGNPDDKGRLVDGAPLVVSGLFRPVDRANGIWDGLPQLLQIIEPQGDGQPFVIVGVVAQSPFNKRAAEGWPIQTNWRYRLGVDRIDARELNQLIDGLQVLQRNQPPELTLTQGVDVPLRAFAAQIDAVRTLLAVIAAGVLATLAGLIVLAASLATRRRRSEFALLRARGAGPPPAPVVASPSRCWWCRSPPCWAGGWAPCSPGPRIRPRRTSSR